MAKAKVEIPLVRDLSDRGIDQFSLDDVVYCHLSRRSWEPYRDGTIHTTLDAIEMEMRQSRGAQITSRYVPLLAAFSIIEQLGDCYVNGNLRRHPDRGGGVERGLYYFANYPAMSSEVKALYALRNGLVHAGSLTSVDQGSEKRYIFRYDREMRDTIALAETEWDGQVSTVSRKVVTRVNPRVFTDQISSAISRVRDLYFYDHDNLRVIAQKGVILINHLLWDLPT